MANFQLVEEQDRKKSNKIKKIVGIILMVLSSIAMISLFSGVIGFLENFLLGAFGVSAYPIFIITFVIGIAFMTKKKYVMSTRYIVALVLAFISVLAIIDLALMHNFSGGYGQYLSYFYTKKWTAGGFLIGFITAPFRYLLFEAGAFVVFILLLIVSIALIVDYFYFAKKFHKFKRPVKVIVPSEEKSASELAKIEKREKRRERREKEIIPIGLDAKTESEKNVMSAKEKLGLIRNSTPLQSDNIKNDRPPIMKREDVIPTDKKSLRAYLLSKPEKIDADNYFRRAQKKPNQSLSENEIQNNFEKIKSEATPLIRPEKIVHEDEEYSGFKHQEPTYYDSRRPQLIQNDSFENDDKQDNNSHNEAKNDDEDGILSKLEKEVLESINSTENINLNAKPEDLDSTRRERRREFSQTKMDEPKPITPIEEKIPSFVKSIEQTVYKIPSIDEIFDNYEIDLQALNKNIVDKKAQLEYALGNFNIQAKVIDVVVGPSVTRYELEMPPGISVKKLATHSEDIAYSLASNGAIRIETPIPGRSACGVEVPNDVIATVGIKEIIASEEFNDSKYDLPIAVGKDIAGEIKICDLVKMPHLLVAGATNSGKSVFLNSVICSLVYKCSPKDLKLILIDPKCVEFSMYNDLPHLVLPKVITDSEKAINALTWCTDEMDRRFTFLQSFACRSIQEYNSLPEVKNGEKEKMPYVVVVVDELAELMNVSKKDIEIKFQRLAQKGRAAGIHLVLATQRPSVDVITGTIKANFPSRISFFLTSFMDSKTILDMGGAEKLLGKGDMLYKPSDVAFPARIQGCFISRSELQRYLSFIRENNHYDYDGDIALAINAPRQSNVSELLDGKQDNGFDELMGQALRLVIDNGTASNTILQRRLGVGYPRAAKIIDQMEQAGFVSKQDGSKPREVFMTLEEWEEKFKKDQE